jgi:Dolichyl-phosphate-mannose-protein mannosyltransferase
MQDEAARVRSTQETDKGLLLRKPTSRLLPLVILLVAGFCTRLYKIGEPPMDVTGMRQYHSALLARGFYEWLLTGNLKTMPPDGIIEPPVLDFLASLAYAITGGEHLWIPRLLSATFWMVGGVFLYLIARKIVSSNAALFSVGFYLFVPAAVLLSRAFMPDPLMIMMLIISVFTILRYHERPTTGRLLVAAVASSVALLVKPGICLFQIFGAFVALMVYRKGSIRALFSVHLLVFAVLVLIPMGLYSAWFLHGYATSRIEPEQWVSLNFWRGWLWQLGYMVGYVAFVGALLGVLLSRPGPPRALMAGLWGGYFLFGFVFARHIHTHDYYSLQLIPVVALSLGSLWDALARIRWRETSGRFLRVTIVGVLLLALALSVVEDKETVLLIARQGQGAAFPGKYVTNGTIADFERRAEIYREAGEIVNHSPRTIVFAPDYGYSLAYHGRLDHGRFWYLSPERRKTVRKDFAALYEENSPRYAIVIKRFAYYPRQVDWGGRKKGKGHRGLRTLLTKKFGVMAEGHSYIVFDLRETGAGKSKDAG